MTSSPTDNGSSILITFKDVETADYVRLILRRKGICLEGYILDNFEWDDPINCVSDLNEGEKITAATCVDCDYTERCPDVVK
ncbi:MAG: hypothetical protein PHT77_05535 [Bacteroidales bacterium]|nr:hypothetical protein [Bacteroidales bacterium]